MLIILALALAFLSSELMQKSQTNTPIYETHSHTKAICDKTNYCQDYYIRCNGKDIVSINPITGAAVQFDSNWQDPRNDSEINGLC